MVKEILAITLPILLILTFVSVQQANAIPIPSTIIHVNKTYTPLKPVTVYTPHQTLKFPIIEILRSPICDIMEKNNMPSSCPTITELSKYDTSNQFISGHFIQGPYGDLIRTKPQIKNNWMYYKTPIVCVDCQTDLFHPDVVKTIFIESKPFTYINKTEVSTNGKFTTFTNQVFQGCNSATIFYSPGLLNQTIHYLLSDCKIKVPQGNKTNILPDHPFMPKDSVQIAYNNYLKQAQKQSLGNCINFKCDIKSYGNKFFS